MNSTIQDHMLDNELYHQMDPVMPSVSAIKGNVEGLVASKQNGSVYVNSCTTICTVFVRKICNLLYLTEMMYTCVSYISNYRLFNDKWCTKKFPNTEK